MNNVVGDARRDEIEYVTRNFAGLQGLKFVPVAVFFAVWGTSEAGMLQGTAWWVLFWLSIVGVVAGMPAIGAWYRRRFGRVERSSGAAVDRRIVVAVVAMIAIAAVVVAAGVAGLLPEMPHVAWTALLAGGVTGMIGWLQGPLARRVNPWTHRTGFVIALAGALPIGMVAGLDAHPLRDGGAMALVFAAFFLVNGVASHRGLVRLLDGRR